MEAEDKLLISRINDLFRLCEKYSCERFSSFLDGGEQAIIEDNIHFPYGFNTMMFGGFSNSESKILGVFPEWSEPTQELFPIAALRITGGFSKPLTHRDYLGSVLSLGIDRSKIGDIVVDSEKSAFCFVCDDIAGYICDNLHKIGNQGVSIEIVPFDEAMKAEHKFMRMELICASMRADAVVGAVTKLSRQKSSELISGGKVKINHRYITDNSKPVKENDLISIRGFGRYIVRQEGSKTRKDRLHISIDKYL